jgi:hypothetical protein
MFAVLTLLIFQLLRTGWRQLKLRNPHLARRFDSIVAATSTFAKTTIEKSKIVPAGSWIKAWGIRQWRRFWGSRFEQRLEKEYNESDEQEYEMSVSSNKQSLS